MVELKTNASVQVFIAVAVVDDPNTLRHDLFAELVLVRLPYSFFLSFFLF